MNLNKIWKNILSIGRHDKLDFLDIQRNSILNGITTFVFFITIIISAIYTYYDFSNKYIALISWPVCGFVLWLNYNKKYKTAKITAFIGFLLSIIIWSWYTRRSGAELMFIVLACGSASILSKKRHVFICAFLCAIAMTTYTILDRVYPFEIDPTINYFVINTILRAITGSAVFILTIIFIDITYKYSKKLESNLEKLNQAYGKQKITEEELIVSNKRLTNFNNKLDIEIKDTNHELTSYQSVINDNLFSIVTDHKGIILEINNIYLEKTGYNRDEIIGKNIDELKSKLHDTNFYDQISEIINSGKVWRGESMIQCKDGSFFWLSSTILPILKEKRVHSFLTISANITDQKTAIKKEKTALESLTKSEKRLSLFLENQLDLVVITNKQGDRKYVNKAFCDFFGESKEYFIGSNYRILNADDLDVSYLESFDSISYENPKITITIVRKNTSGEKRWIKWDEIAFFDDDKNVIEILSIGHDITEMKESEFQKASYITQFEEIAFKNSHKFRKPLSNIIGVIDLIDYELTNSEVNELVTIVKNEISDLDLASHELSSFINKYSTNASHDIKSIDFDFSNAKFKHLKWKYRIRHFLDGTGSLTKSQALSHRHCEIGKWFYDEGKIKYGHIESVKKFELEHENLHNLLQEILDLKEKGNLTKAEDKYLELVESSDKIILLLDEVALFINDEIIV